MKKYKRDFSSGKERGFKKGRSRGSRRPGMHEATCISCGKACEVPFKPTGEKPIYCSNCFEKNQNEDSGRSSRERNGRNFKERSFGGRHSHRPTKHKTICDKCGIECEVPFRPTAGKPIYCDNCFDHSGSNKEKGIELLKNEIEIINKKLDKILKTLTIVLSEKKAPEEGEVVKVEKKIADPKSEKKSKKTTTTKTAAKKKATAKKVAKKKE